MHLLTLRCFTSVCVFAALADWATRKHAREALIVKVKGKRRNVRKNYDVGNGHTGTAFKSRKGEVVKLEKIFYINRDVRTDRRLIMDAALQKTGIAFERFPAVELPVSEVLDLVHPVLFRETHPLVQYVGNGSTSQYIRFLNATSRTQSFDFAKRLCLESHACLLQKQAFVLGTMFSHMSLLERIAAMDGIDSDSALVMILEDDYVLIENEWKLALAKTVLELPETWHMLRLNVRNVPGKGFKHGGSAFLHRAMGSVSNFHGTHCIITSPSRAAHVLQQYKRSTVQDYDEMCTTNLFVSLATAGPDKKNPRRSTQVVQHIPSPSDHANFVYRQFGQKDRSSGTNDTTAAAEVEVGALQKAAAPVLVIVLAIVVAAFAGFGGGSSTGSNNPSAPCLARRGSTGTRN